MLGTKYTKDSLTSLHEALGVMGIDPKPSNSKPPIESTKTSPILQPKWFGPLARSLLQSDIPVVESRNVLDKLSCFQHTIQTP